VIDIFPCATKIEDTREKQEQAKEFRRALRQLASALESKVDTIRMASKVPWKYRTNYESTANLSRVSLPCPATIGPITKATMEASDIKESRQLSRPENLSRGQSTEVDYNKSGKNPSNIFPCTGDSRSEEKRRSSSPTYAGDKYVVDHFWTTRASSRFRVHILRSFVSEHVNLDVWAIRLCHMGASFCVVCHAGT
jgi:hypothetical protein